MGGGTSRWREMYEGVKRWHARLVDTNDADTAYAFFIFCYHLKDWIKNDASVDQKIREKVKGYVNNTPALGLAGDIANGVKHLVRRPSQVRVDPAARVSAISSPISPLGAAQGVSRFVTPPHSVTLVIVGEHTRKDARDTANQCMQAWADFMSRHGLV